MRSPRFARDDDQIVAEGSSGGMNGLYLVGCTLLPTRWRSRWIALSPVSTRATVRRGMLSEQRSRPEHIRLTRS